MTKTFDFLISIILILPLDILDLRYISFQRLIGSQIVRQHFQTKFTVGLLLLCLRLLGDAKLGENLLHWNIVFPLLFLREFADLFRLASGLFEFLQLKLD